MLRNLSSANPVQSCESLAGEVTAHVFGMGDGFQMIGVDTATVSAEMIQFHAFGNGAVLDFVLPLVSRGSPVGASVFIPNTDLRTASAIERTLPHPASGFRFHHPHLPGCDVRAMTSNVFHRLTRNVTERRICALRDIRQRTTTASTQLIGLWWFRSLSPWATTVIAMAGNTTPCRIVLSRFGCKKFTREHPVATIASEFSFLPQGLCPPENGGAMVLTGV